MISKSISIFGLGYVGCVSVACLAKAGYTIIGVDVNQSKVDLVNKGIPTIIEPGLDQAMLEALDLNRISATTDVYTAVAASEILLITVGTPSQADGDLDLTNIFSVAKEIGIALSRVQEKKIIIIRSTVKPGTCKLLAKSIEKTSGRIDGVDFCVVSNPEFLREGTAIDDYMNPPYVLIGSRSKTAANVVGSLYSNVNAKVLLVELETAEIIKYVNNSWHALKVVFGNEIGSICKALGVNSREVIDLFCRDSILNISSAYLSPGFAYGGSCLPKDLSGLLALSRGANLCLPLLENINKSNEAHIIRALALIKNFGQKTRLGFLGLSFKSATDDVRNSPALKLIKILHREGYQIRVYDNIVSLAISKNRNAAVLKNQLQEIADLLVDNPKEIIEFSEVIVITKKDEAFSSIIDSINEQKIIDLVDIKNISNTKFNYHGLAW